MPEASAQVVQMQQMTAEQVKAYYTKRAAYYPLIIKMLGYRLVIQALLADRDVLTSDMKVLDAGAGTGLMTRILYPLAREKGLSNIAFHAFDLTQAMLDVLRGWIRAEGAEDVISTRIQNVLQLETLPETWNNYDLIVSSGMLEYIPPDSLHKVLAGLIDRLKPGGKLICVFSGRTIPMRIFVGWMQRCNLYTKSELDVIIAKAGATDVRHLPFPRPYQATDGQLLAVEITRP
ncbi:MAG: class I SAM-dependent methyltransferase [Deltaproteobacteria bacterium]|nr:class I SAM-dependent methyltransferase [Deltaproteobacteria bacterium]